MPEPKGGDIIYECINMFNLNQLRPIWLKNSWLELVAVKEKCRETMRIKSDTVLVIKQTSVVIWATARDFSWDTGNAKSQSPEIALAVQPPQQLIKIIVDSLELQFRCLRQSIDNLRIYQSHWNFIKHLRF